MNNTPLQKVHAITKDEIAKILGTESDLDVREIKASQCDKVCWSMERGNQRIDVELRDIEIEGNLDSPAIFTLRMCDVSTENKKMTALAVQYYFHIEVDTSALSIGKAAALVNDMNLAPSYVKTVLLNITDTGYGFCSEARFNITNIDDILECYNAIKFPVQRAASSAIMKINYYLQNKSQFDWEKKSVKYGDIEKYDNYFTLNSKQSASQQPHYMIKDSAAEDEAWYLRGLNNEIDKNWRGAIECYRKAVESNGFYAETARCKAADVFENKLHDYRMAEVWGVSYDTELGIDMLLRRNLWRRAFIQARRDVDDNIEALQGLLIKEFDERGKDNFWHEKFTNHSVDMLCAINDYLKVFRKANIELNGGDLFNYEKWLNFIQNSIGAFYVIEKNKLQGNPKPTEKVKIWPPVPQDYPYDEEHWHSELEERAELAKKL